MGEEIKSFHSKGRQSCRCSTQEIKTIPNRQEGRLRWQAGRAGADSHVRKGELTMAYEVQSGTWFRITIHTHYWKFPHALLKCSHTHCWNALSHTTEMLTHAILKHSHALLECSHTLLKHSLMQYWYNLTHTTEILKRCHRHYWSTLTCTTEISVEMEGVFVSLECKCCPRNFLVGWQKLPCSTTIFFHRWRQYIF